MENYSLRIVLNNVREKPDIVVKVFIRTYAVAE